MGLPALKIVPEPRPPRRSVWGPILGSLAFHALFLSTIPVFYEGNIANMKGLPVKPGEKILRVKMPPPPPASEASKSRPFDPQGEVVDLFDNKNATAKAPDNSKYLSDRNRAVEKETQARNTGPNPNAAVGQPGPKGMPQSNVGSAKQSADSKSKSQSKPKNGQGLNLALPDSFLNKVAAPKGSPQGSEQVPGDRVASLAPTNYLPGIGLGDETLLNTREYVYASFFVRMKRQMEGVWNPSPLIHSGTLSKQEYITVVRIILERDGRVKSAQVVKPSGSSALDQEAVHAVYGAAPYMNPPMGMGNEEGQIEIPNWHFIVTLSAIF